MIRSLIKRALSLLLATSLLPVAALPLQAASGPALKPYTASYRVSMGQFVIGSVDISLSLSGNGSYRYQAYTAPVGLAAVFRKDEITERSEGKFEDARVVPETYHYSHKKPKRTRNVNLDFDWQASQVTNQTADSHWTMEIPPGTQDKFSQQLALILALSRGEKQAEFKVADGGLLKTYRYTEVGRETIKINSDQYQTIRLDRNKGDRPSRASLWFAPSLNYLPIRITKDEEDGDYMMELISVTWQEKEG